MDEHPLIYPSFNPFVWSVPAVHVFVLEEDCKQHREKPKPESTLKPLLLFSTNKEEEF